MNTPEPPDPYETAAAQGGMNRDTAITQAQLGMTTQVNPWGTVSYEQTGQNSFTDSQGNVINTPSYTQTTNLSPEQQAIFDASQGAQGNLANLAQEQSGFLKDYLARPFEYTNQDAENWAYDLASPRLLKQQGQNDAQLRSILANKGIREGSAAWDAEMARMTNANTDQLNQLALTGRAQAFGENLATRNQPINEITALLSGSQVSNPSQMSPSAPSPSVGGVDYTGLVNQEYQANLANSQNRMGGLFGLGSAALGLFSDRRLKTDIKRIGVTDGGVPIYTFRYGGEGPFHMGVMAQEAPPSSVMRHESGYLMVDYSGVN